MYVLVYFSTDNIAVTLHRLQITEIWRKHIEVWMTAVLWQGDRKGIWSVKTKGV